MIGVAVLILSVFFYINKLRPLSLVLFFVLLLKGMCLIPLISDGIKTIDMALIFIFVILFFHLATDGVVFFRSDKIANLIWLLMAFFALSSFVSMAYYQIPPVKVFTVVRGYLYILAYFIFRNLSYQECRKLLSILAVVTFVSCVLYIAQIPLKTPLLAMNHEMNTDTTRFGGLMRFINIPPLRTMFIYLSFFAFGYYSKFTPPIVQRGVFLLALILAFGRGAMFSVILPLLLGIYAGRKKAIISIIVVSVIALPVISIVFNSFVEGRDTTDDLKLLLNGGFVNYETGYTSGSTAFTYRIAWVYERLKYIVGRPMIEWLFGLGLVSEQDPLATAMYRFNVVDFRNESESFQLLYSSDIGFGNFITRFGILGTIVMFAIWGHLFKLFYSQKGHGLMLAGLLLLIENFLETFSSRGISETSALIPYFMLLSYHRRWLLREKKIGSK